MWHYPDTNRNRLVPPWDDYLLACLLAVPLVCYLITFSEFATFSHSITFRHRSTLPYHHPINIPNSHHLVILRRSGERDKESKRSLDPRNAITSDQMLAYTSAGNEGKCQSDPSRNQSTERTTCPDPTTHTSPPSALVPSVERLISPLHSTRQTPLRTKGLDVIPLFAFSRLHDAPLQPFTTRLLTFSSPHPYHSANRQLYTPVQIVDH